MTLCDDIRYLTERALWETENLIRCVPDELWDKRYDELPIWKYIYHMLYSMDRWYINPADPDYRDPSFHREGLADLNVVPGPERVERALIEAYFAAVAEKIRRYAADLRDEDLAQCPPGCDMSRFRLILGQFRHWHRHMGVVYGFLVEDTGRWPYVLNMLGEYPKDPMPNFYP